MHCRSNRVSSSMTFAHFIFFILTFLFLTNQNYSKTLQSPSRFKRVVNGSYNNIKNWTWLVSIKNYPLRKYIEREKPSYMNWSTVGNDSHICGASLIDRSWIVSAAHCLDYDGTIFKSHWIAHLGSHDLKYKENDQQIIEVDRVWFFDNSTEYNDIVLMHLSKPARITERVKPVCVRNQKLNTKNLECIAMGWGSTVSLTENSLSPRPKYFYAKYINYLEPNCLFEGSDIRTLCFSPITGLSCRGDSGGPLVCRNSKNDPWTLVGITSSGTGCRTMSDKMVFTNVSYYYSFLKHHLKQFDFCSNSSSKTELLFLLFFLYLFLKYFI